VQTTPGLVPEPQGLPENRRGRVREHQQERQAPGPQRPTDLPFREQSPTLFGGNEQWVQTQQPESHERHRPMKCQQHVQPEGGLDPTQPRGNDELQRENRQGNDGTVHAHFSGKWAMGMGPEDDEPKKRTEDQQNVESAE
jgi:hypothetical protein